MNRGFKGIWIPRELWLSKELTIQEKVLLAEIDSLDTEEGCYASNEYFAEFLGLSKERARKIIASLKDKGYISINLIYKQGTKEVDTRYIKVIKGYGQIQPEGMVKNDQQGMVKSDHYITNNNNKINNIYIEQCNELWKMYPKKVGKKRAYDKMPKLIKEYSFEQLKRCIERYSELVKDKDPQYILQGDTFFNGRFEDYLDENYAGNDIIDQKEGDNTYDEEYFKSLLNKDMKE